MAKRKKRRRYHATHIPSFKLQTKSIIPTQLPRNPTTNAINYKQIRNNIRNELSTIIKKAIAEQKKPLIPTPKEIYKSNKKKNRKKAREKRKERKEKVKQLQQKPQQEQPKQTPQFEPEPEPIEEPIPWQDATRDEDYRTETLDYDDTDNYIEDLISMIQSVSDTLQETYGKWYMGAEQWILELNKLEYWLEEALQLPYDTKLAICDTLEGNSYLEEVRNVMHLEHYKEVEQSIVAVTDEIISIIESAY